MKPIIRSEIYVSVMMDRYPATLQVFRQWKLPCIGCSMASFCNLADVAENYSLNLSALIAEMQNAIEVNKTKGDFRYEQNLSH